MERGGDGLNAWCDYPAVAVPHAAQGPLAGMRLAVKDIFPVAGYPNGWGSPTRLSEADIDTETAPAVQALLDAGAQVVGKAQCEELCFSLTGINRHYGAPVNPRAPERVTGGSSSGSVSLTAAGVVDMATGSDTGGSVRAPASYTGLLGLRTTHGRIPLDGAMPLAPSYDVFGWFTHDPADYDRVGAVLLGEDGDATPLTRTLRVAELDDRLLGEADRKAYADAMASVDGLLGARADTVLPFDLTDAYWTFRRTQAAEAWETLGPWIESRRPDLGPGVKDRFEYGRDLDADEVAQAVRHRQELRRQIEDTLGLDGVLVFPTMPSCAPRKDDGEAALEDFRNKALALLCLSGISGLPQITVPLAQVHGAPLGVSLMGPRGSDRRLISLAMALLA